METEHYELRERFAARLGEALKMTTITSSQLAKRLGVTKSTISMYLHANALPSLEVFCRISEILDVSADFLLGKKEI